MPYINDEGRKQVETNLMLLMAKLDDIPDDKIDGMLNYVVSRIIAGRLGQDGWRYAKIARAVAVFAAAGAEFYRRVAGPYEDKCIASNGDIPEYKS
jgi:hypothetical protein